MKEIVLPPYGFVELIDHKADDLDVVQAAKISYNKHQGIQMGPHEKGLINYLMREGHSSPFQMNYFKFLVKAPIFVFREWQRHVHRIGLNESSGRYIEMKREFYVPKKTKWRTQIGKPGKYEYKDLDQNIGWGLSDRVVQICNKSFDMYEYLLERGAAKEQARMVLPINTYSEMIWAVNSLSLMNFLRLRNASDAQGEIRDYAKAIERMFQVVMPITHEAFVSQGRPKL